MIRDCSEKLDRFILNKYFVDSLNVKFLYNCRTKIKEYLFAFSNRTEALDKLHFCDALLFAGLI